MKKLYKEQFEKGKKVVEEIKKREEQSSASKSAAGENNIVSRLRELAELKEQGIITEEEFAAMKKKILTE